MMESRARFSLSIRPTTAETHLLDECYDISRLLDYADVPGLLGLWANASPAFKTAFPKVEGIDDPFFAFVGIFSDAAYTTFDTTDFGVQGDGSYLIEGSQVDVGAIAKVIQKCAPSVLPITLEWEDGFGNFERYSISRNNITEAHADRRTINPLDPWRGKYARIAGAIILLIVVMGSVWFEHDDDEAFSASCRIDGILCQQGE